MKTLKPAIRNWWFEIIVALTIGLIGIAAPFFLPVAAAAILVPIYHRLSKKYMIDENKIESTYGLISREVQSIRLQDLRNINLKQSFLQRVMNTGDLEFSSSAGSGIEVVFKGVSRPVKLKRHVEEMQSLN